MCDFDWDALNKAIEDCFENNYKHGYCKPRYPVPTTLGMVCYDAAGYCIDIEYPDEELWYDGVVMEWWNESKV